MQSRWNARVASFHIVMLTFVVSIQFVDFFRVPDIVPYYMVNLFYRAVRSSKVGLGIVQHQTLESGIHQPLKVPSK